MAFVPRALGLLLLAGLALAAELTTPALREVNPGEVVVWLFSLRAGETLEGEPASGFVSFSKLPRKGPGYAPVSVQVPPTAPAGRRLAFVARVGGETYRLFVRVRLVPRVGLEVRPEPPFLRVRLTGESNGRVRYRLRVERGEWRWERLVELAPDASRTFVFTPPPGIRPVRVEAWVEGRKEESRVVRSVRLQGVERAEVPGEFRLRGELSGYAALGGEPALGFSLQGPLSDYLRAGVQVGYPWRTLLWARGQELGGSVYWASGMASAAFGLRTPEGGYISGAGAYAWGNGERWSATLGFRAPGVYAQGEYLEYDPARWVLAVSGAYYGRESGIASRIAWDAGAGRATASLRARWSWPGFSLRTGVMRVFPLEGSPQTTFSLGAGFAGHGGELRVRVEPEWTWRLVFAGPLDQGVSYRFVGDGSEGLRFSVGRRVAGGSVGAELRYPWDAPFELAAWVRSPPLPFLPRGGQAEFRAVPARGEFSVGVSGELAYPLADGEALLSGLLAWPLDASSLRLGFRLGDDLQYLEASVGYVPPSALRGEVRLGLFDPDAGRIELTGGYAAGRFDLKLSGVWRFDLPVPPELTEAAGGTRAGAIAVCLEVEGTDGTARVGIAETGRSFELAAGSCRRIPVFPGKWHVRLLALPPGALPAPGEGREVAVRVREREVVRVVFRGVLGGRIEGVLEGEEVPPEAAFAVSGGERELVVRAVGGRFALGPLMPGSYRLRPLPYGLPSGVRIVPEERVVRLAPGEVVRVVFRVEVERQGVQRVASWRLVSFRLPLDRLPPGAQVEAVARVRTEAGEAPKRLQVLWHGEVLGVLTPEAPGVYRGRLHLPEHAGTLRLEIEGAGWRETSAVVLDPDAPWGVAKGFGLLGSEGAWAELVFFAPAERVEVEVDGPVAWEAASLEDRFHWRVRFSLSDPNFRGIVPVRISARLANGKTARLGGLLLVR